MRLYAFILFIAASLPFIVFRPILGLCYYTCFNLVRPEMLFWGGTMGSKALLSVIAVTALGVVVNAKLDLSSMARWYMITPLLIWCALAISIQGARWKTPDQWTFANEILKVWVVCYLVHVLIENGKHFYQWVGTIIYSGTFLATWGVEQYLRGNYRLEGLGGNAMSDSNYIAAHFVLTLPLCLVKMLHGRSGREKLVGALCSASYIAVIVCTQSRGGLLGTVAALGVFTLWSPGKERRRLLLATTVLLVVASPFITGAYIERMSTMRSMDTMDTSGKSRLALWEAGWYVFLENPLTGCGYMNYPREKIGQATKFIGKLDSNEIEAWIMPLKVTHSMYFQILSEGGLLLFTPVMLLYLGTIFYNLAASRRYRDQPWGKDPPLAQWLLAVAAGIAGWMVCMVFLDGVVNFFTYVLVAFSGHMRYVLKAREYAEQQGEAGPEIKRMEPRVRAASCGMATPG